MKNWYESKSVWLALLQFLAGVIALLIGLLQGNTEITMASLLPMGKSVVDLYLRFKTDSGIRKINL